MVSFVGIYFEHYKSNYYQNNCVYTGCRLKIDERKPHEHIASARRKAAATRDARDAAAAGAITATPYFGSPYVYLGYPTPYTHGYSPYQYSAVPYGVTPSPDSGATFGIDSTGPPPAFNLGPYGQVDYYGQGQHPGPMVQYAVQYGPQADVFHQASPTASVDSNAFVVVTPAHAAAEGYANAQ
jgi:hypothetical protein